MLLIHFQMSTWVDILEKSKRDKLFDESIKRMYGDSHAPPDGWIQRRKKDDDGPHYDDDEDGLRIDEEDEDRRILKLLMIIKTSMLEQKFYYHRMEMW